MKHTHECMDSGCGWTGTITNLPGAPRYCPMCGQERLNGPAEPVELAAAEPLPVVRLRSRAIRLGEFDVLHIDWERRVVVALESTGLYAGEDDPTTAGEATDGPDQAE